MSVRRIQLEDPVTCLPGVGARRAAALAEVGVATVVDAVMRVPRSYWTRAPRAPIVALAASPASGEVAIVGEVRSARTRRRGRRSTTRVRLEDESGAVEVVFFNQGYLARSLPRGARIWVQGRVERREDGVGLVASRHGRVAAPDGGDPDAAIGPAAEDPAPREVRVARYDLPDGVPEASWRRAVAAGLDATAADLDAAANDPRRTDLPADLPPLGLALRTLHAPPVGATVEDLEGARRRVAYEELLAIAVPLRVARERVRSTVRAAALTIPPEEIEARLAALPFEPTEAQRRAVAEVVSDLRAPHPMHRLLQGDVGTGKTAVAACALAAVARTGATAAMLVPTALLAEQHAATLAPYLAGAGVPLEVLTARGATSPASASDPAATDPRAGRVVVGTHALLGARADLRGLRLAVVDEQHRFGVSQRARLRDRGDDVDLLVMTATPIPRSLLLALYGDLDVTVLTERPPGRGSVSTRVLEPGERDQALGDAVAEARAGGRVFVVCPRIESEVDDGRAAAERVTATLRRRVGAGLDVAVVHGRRTPEQNVAAVARFRAGEAPILVATVMIEVGLDVPTATTMVVLDAERFGLATLHQLRGRVGRGAREGRCVLVPGAAADADARARLAVLERSSDGLEIAEEDLRLRGPGAAFGGRQHGRLTLRCARVPRDLDLVGRAREAAAGLVAAAGGDTGGLPVWLRRVEGPIGPG